MLGPSHALSGAAVWLAGSLALDHFAHFHQNTAAIAIGTAICAGGALAPDLDMSGRVTRNRGGATVAHTFGVVSLFVAECVEKFSLGVYDLTKTKHDPRRHNGHRTLTHTLLFNLALGFGVFEACTHYGKTAVLVTLFLAFAFALRGLFPGWSKRAGWIIVTGAAAYATWWADQHLPLKNSYPLLGIAIGVGGIVHLLGDMITSHGCPALWPMPIEHETWHCIGVPNDVAVKVGGAVEIYVLRTLFFIIAVLAAADLSDTWLSHQVHRLTG